MDARCRKVNFEGLPLFLAFGDGDSLVALTFAFLFEEEEPLGLLLFSVEDVLKFQV